MIAFRVLVELLFYVSGEEIGLIPRLVLIEGVTGKTIRGFLDSISRFYKINFDNR